MISLASIQNTFYKRQSLTASHMTCIPDWFSLGWYAQMRLVFAMLKRKPADTDDGFLFGVSLEGSGCMRGSSNNNGRLFSRILRAIAKFLSESAKQIGIPDANRASGATTPPMGVQYQVASRRLESEPLS